MVKQNIAIAIIIIVLFIILSLVAFGIYAAQNQVSIFARRKAETDEEELADD